MFETETMAELCIKQGLLAEGVDIYRRLLRGAPDEMTRARRRRRLAELERELRTPGGARPSPPPVPVEEPALTARQESEGLVIEWSLPAALRAPALQLLLLTRTKAGIAAETRTLHLEAPRGRTTVAAPTLHSFRAAAGHLDGERFIPLVRVGML
jgi:hypothetical protein